MEGIYIITPCRNARKTISQTIESVLSQSTKYHIFYHIQDGMSDDNTQELLEGYKNKIQKDVDLNKRVSFTWDSVKDNSMYDAISIAVKKLSIPDDCFMGWINADDILTPNCFSILEKAAHILPELEWIGGVLMVQDMNGNIVQGQHGNYPQYFLQQGLCDGIHWNFFQQEGVFFKKKIFDMVDGFNPTLRLAGDWDLWRRMAAIANFIQTPWPMGIFRMRPNQLSQNMSEYQHEMAKIIPVKTRREASWHISGLNGLPVLVLNEDGGKYYVSEVTLTHAILQKRSRFFISTEVSSYALAKVNQEVDTRMDQLEMRLAEQAASLDILHQRLDTLRWSLRHPFSWFFRKLRLKLLKADANNS